MLRFERLKAKDVVCFKNLYVEFDARWNVLLGDNASGKSSLLRILTAASLGQFPSTQLGPAMIRSGTAECELTVTLRGNRNEVVWASGEDRSEGQFTCRDGLISTPGTYRQVQWDLEFDSGRISNTGPLELGEKTPIVAIPAIRPAGPTPPDFATQIKAAPAASAIRADQVNRMLQGRDDLSGLQQVADAYLRQSLHQLKQRSEFVWEFTAYQRCIERLLEGYQLVEFDFDRGRLELSGPNGTFPMHALSDGEKSVLAIGLRIAEGILYQGGQVVPDLFDRPAIILIDELDAHLHPRWQREIVRRLDRLCPNAQFVVATHSPQLVLGMIGLGSSYRVHRLLRRDHGVVCESVTSGDGGLLGMTIQEILIDLFNTPTLPPRVVELQEQVASLLGLIGAKRATSEQQAKLDELHRNILDLSGRFVDSGPNASEP